MVAFRFQGLGAWIPSELIDREGPKASFGLGTLGTAALGETTTVQAQRPARAQLLA